jgi:hypothetical protein
VKDLSWLLGPSTRIDRERPVEVLVFGARVLADDNDLGVSGAMASNLD